MAETPLNHKLAHWIQANFRGFIAFFGVCFVAGIGAFSWSQWSQFQDKKIYTELYDFKTKLNQALSSANKGENFRDKDQNIYKIFKKNQAPPVYSKAMDTVALEYENQIKHFIHRTAVAPFVIDLSDYYYEKGETQRAQNLLDSFVTSKKLTGLVQLASLQLISYYMDQKLCAKALPLLKQITKTKKAKPFHAEAWIKQGICYEAQKEWKKAEEMYKKNIDSSDSFYSRIADDYLKLLKFHKELNLK